MRQLLKNFGITAQREIEKHVRDALAGGQLKGTEALVLRARLAIEGLPPEIVVDGRIALE